MLFNPKFYIRIFLTVTDQKPILVVSANTIKQPSLKDHKLANSKLWFRVFYMDTVWSSQQSIYYFYYHLKQILGDYCIIYENGAILDPSKYTHSPYANIHEFIDTLKGESSTEFRLYNDMIKYIKNVKQILFDHDIYIFYCTRWSNEHRAMHTSFNTLAEWQRFFVSKTMPLKVALKILIFAIELYLSKTNNKR